MRQVTRKSLVTVAAAGGVLALSGGSAFADSTADGGTAHSPGVGSGNNVQVPVHVPVNACGNTVNVVGLLNPAFGNDCVNESSDDHHGKHHGKHHDDHHGKHGGSGAHAEGGAENSPGVGSGNNVQAPVHVPANVCGNTVDVASVLNPAFGNECTNGPEDAPEWEEPPSEHPDEPEPHNPDKPGVKTPDKPVEHPSAPQPQTETRTVAQPQLAETGSGADLGLGLSLSAGLLLGGTVLYRRARAAQR